MEGTPDRVPSIHDRDVLTWMDRKKLSGDENLGPSYTKFRDLEYIRKGVFKPSAYG